MCYQSRELTLDFCPISSYCSLHCFYIPNICKFIHKADWHWNISNTFLDRRIFYNCKLFPLAWLISCWNPQISPLLHHFCSRDFCLYSNFLCFNNRCTCKFPDIYFLNREIIYLWHSIHSTFWGIWIFYSGRRGLFNC